VTRCCAQRERLSLGVAIAACLAIPCGSAMAGMLVYELPIEDGRRLSYEVGVPARHPGLLTVEAEWTGPRVIAFRLEGPGPAAHRSGPSPQRLEVQLDAKAIAAAEPYRLSIRSLPMRGAGTATLRVFVPDPPRTESVPGAATPPHEDSTSPTLRELPEGSPASWHRLTRSTERFRGSIADRSVPDACRWQTAMLAYADGVRERLIDGGPTPSRITRKALRQIAGSIERVEAQRLSDDPLLSDPQEHSEEEIRSWARLRQRQVQTLKEHLDSVRSDLRRGYAPELASEPWPLRLVGCITACERFFDERALRGPERATNVDLARAQWKRMLAAQQLLEALVSLGPPTD